MPRSRERIGRALRRPPSAAFRAIWCARATRAAHVRGSQTTCVVRCSKALDPDRGAGRGAGVCHCHPTSSATASVRRPGRSKPRYSAGPSGLLSLSLFRRLFTDLHRVRQSFRGRLAPAEETRARRARSERYGHGPRRRRRQPQGEREPPTRAAWRRGTARACIAPWGRGIGARSHVRVQLGKSQSFRGVGAAAAAFLRRASVTVFCFVSS